MSLKFKGRRNHEAAYAYDKWHGPLFHEPTLLMFGNNIPCLGDRIHTMDPIDTKNPITNGNCLIRITVCLLIELS